MDTTVTVWEDGTEEQAANVILSEDMLTAIYISIGVLGLLGNLLVTLVISRSKQMRKQLANVYILNQSLLDGCVAVFLILTSVYEDNGQSQLKKTTTLSDEVQCRLWLTKMPLWGLLVSSSYNLVALTVERYLSVVHPIWHKMHFSSTKANISIVLAWVIGIAYNVAYMTPTAAIQTNGQCTVYSVWPDLTTQRAVGVLTIAVQFFIPLVTLGVCYGRMAMVIAQRIHATVGCVGGGGNGERGERGERGGAKISKAKKNVTKTLFVVSVCFVFCWIWNQTFYLMFNLGVVSDFTSNFYHFTVIMVFCSCCINPFIYASKYKQFQASFLRMFYKKNIHSIGGTTENTQTYNRETQH